MKNEIYFSKNIPADAARRNVLAPEPQPRWRASAKVRGRAFTHAESGDKVLAKEEWLGLLNGMAGSWR